MTSPTLWPDVVDALLTTVAAAVPSVSVFDGMPLTADHMPEGVAIGVSVEDDDGNAGDFAQEWRDAGPAPFAHRVETGAVRCALWVQSGAANGISAARARMYALLQDITDALASMTETDVPGLVSLTPITSAAVRQLLTPDGTYVSCEWRITYRALVA